MKSYRFHTTHRELLADTITPVSVYLRIRDRYPNSLLLESSDYHGQENSFSYICFNPVASITATRTEVSEVFPDGTSRETNIEADTSVPQLVNDFASSFETVDTGFEFVHHGLFGFITYDGVRHFEDIHISTKGNDGTVPDLHYAVFRNIIAIDHFRNKAYLFSHNYNQDSCNLDEVEALLRSRQFTAYRFEAVGEETTATTEGEYLDAVQLAKEHCYRGDVFQLVLSRRFAQGFHGDDFNVYRALRSINPSPYLFYFDFGSYRIFGSSPEAQLVVQEDEAIIHPIAGTFRRTGNDQADAQLARELADDPKENAEHVMLVDLARNDLSRYGDQVEVETYKEVQYYSHVIHLVSKVTARKQEEHSTMDLVAATFPAGTLSGAPKYKAMELIERYEKESRGVYGGCIGFMDFAGNFNNAIIIRSFLSRDNTLFYQAGAGIVADSVPERELQEVSNKLAALRDALALAQTIDA